MMIRSTRAAGLILLILLFLPRPVHGADHARIVVKKGHNYDSEYEICGQFDAQDFSSGRIPTESDRCVIFLGNRYQLVFVHGVTIGNLMEACGIDPEDVQAIHFGGSNFFSADDILHGMNRTYVPDASAYTYVGEGGTVMIDSSNIHYWAAGYGRLALFSDSEDIAFGQTMDHYYDGNVIRSKYEQFRQDLSKEALVEHALEEGLTLYYGQYQYELNYPNRPVNAIRTINVILKDEDDGSTTGGGSVDGDGSGTVDSSGSGGEVITEESGSKDGTSSGEGETDKTDSSGSGSKNRNTGKNSAGSGKSSSGSGKSQSSSSAKAGGTKKTAGTKNSDKTKNSSGTRNSGGTKGTGSYIPKERLTPSAAGGSDTDTSAQRAQQNDYEKNTDQTEPEGKKEESEKEDMKSQDEEDDSTPMQEITEPVSKASAGQMLKLKDSPDDASLTQDGPEAETNIAVIFVMAGLVCCGILAGLVRFRIQLREALASES